VTFEEMEAGLRARLEALPHPETRSFGELLLPLDLCEQRPQNVPIASTDER
jgi:hypothetical protein